MAAIVSTGPVVRIIAPSANSVTIAITLPEPLANDVHKHYAELAAIHQKARFKHITFDEWVESVFRDQVYGPVAPWPEEQG